MGAVKSFFSGVEGNIHYDAAIKAGAKHALMSFMYIEKKGVDIVKNRVKQFGTEFLIDSSAHTFQTNCHQPPYDSWTLKDYENFLDRYVKWLVDNKDYISCAAELDISYPLNMTQNLDADASYGNNIVEDWRANVFQPLQKKGIDIIYVWHGFGGLQGWEEMCQKYPYVGLPGEKSSEPDFNKFITVARRYCTKIHGFAATKQADFKDFPWYSVDSITWKTSEMYGTLIHWDERKQKLMYIEDKTQRSRFKTTFDSLGLDSELIILEGNAKSEQDKAHLRALEKKKNKKAYKEVTKYALHSMTSMEKFYANLYKHRVFYYELRLPHPLVVRKKWGKKEVMSYWKNIKADETFKEHATENRWLHIRDFLVGISSVQYCEHKYYQKNRRAKEFLETYFSGLMTASVDATTFQKELANFIAPPNPAPIERGASDFADTNNPPKVRGEENYELEDIEYRIEPEILDTIYP